MVDCRNSEVGSTRLKRSFDVAFLTGIDVNVKADVQDEEEDFLGANLDIKNKREGKGLVSSVSEEGRVKFGKINIWQNQHFREKLR